MVEPRYPAAVERYVDLGVCYDVAAAKARREEIVRHTTACSAAYQRAFRALAAARAMADSAAALAVEGMDRDKLRRRGEGILSRELRGRGRGEPDQYRFLGSPTCQGPLWRFDTAADLCPRIYQLQDSYDLAAPLLEQIRAAARGRGFYAIVCPDPEHTERIQHLLLPELGLAFLTSRESMRYEGSAYRRIRVDAMVPRRPLPPVPLPAALRRPDGGGPPGGGGGGSGRRQALPRRPGGGLPPRRGLRPGRRDHRPGAGADQELPVARRGPPSPGRELPGDGGFSQSGAPRERREKEAGFTNILLNIPPAKWYTGKKGGAAAGTGGTAMAKNPDTDMSQYSYTQSRELSWLRFNRRVLEESGDNTVPLLERLKFISIFTSNLDEFFMVRVGSLFDLSLVSPNEIDNKTGLTPSGQLDQIYRVIPGLIEIKNHLYREVSGLLRQEGIWDLAPEELTAEEKKYVSQYYKVKILPVLSPQIVDSRHPFPHLVNKALYVAALLRSKKGNPSLGFIPVPQGLPAFLTMPGTPGRFIRMENVIHQWVHTLFGSYRVEDSCVLCVTRNADISFDEEKFEDDDDDFRSRMSKLLKKRANLAVVRLELSRKVSADFLKLLKIRIEVGDHQTYIDRAPPGHEVRLRLHPRPALRRGGPPVLPPLPAPLAGGSGREEQHHRTGTAPGQAALLPLRQGGALPAASQ